MTVTHGETTTSPMGPGEALPGPSPTPSGRVLRGQDDKGINCPNCGHTVIAVLDSRRSRFHTVRRRRRCCGCGFRFSTYEVTMGYGELCGLAKALGLIRNSKMFRGG